MMQPKRTKYRKQFKGTNSGSAHRGSTVAFGEFALRLRALLADGLVEASASRRRALLLDADVTQASQACRIKFENLTVSTLPESSESNVTFIVKGTMQ